MTRHSVGSDLGFTLVELLVATTIMAVITTTLGFAISGVLRSTAGARDRVSRAHDTMMVGFLLPNDVNAASAAGIPGLVACGGGTPVLTLTTTNVVGSTAATVWYGVDGGALVRTVCSGASVSTSSRIVDRVTAPAAECQSWNASAVPPSFVAVACDPWSAVDRVVLTLTLPGTGGASGAVADPARALTVIGARS